MVGIIILQCFEGFSNDDNLLTYGLVHERASTIATIVGHTFLSYAFWSSTPYSLASFTILSIHLMRGLSLGLSPGISMSSAVLVMSPGSPRFMCPYQLSRRLYVTLLQLALLLLSFKSPLFLYGLSNQSLGSSDAFSSRSYLYVWYSFVQLSELRFNGVNENS